MGYVVALDIARVELFHLQIADTAMTICLGHPFCMCKLPHALVCHLTHHAKCMFSMIPCPHAVRHSTKLAVPGVACYVYVCSLLSVCSQARPRCQSCYAQSAQGRQEAAATQSSSSYSGRGRVAGVGRCCSAHAGSAATHSASLWARAGTPGAV